MATDAGTARLYEHFAAPERLTLVLEALARGDEAEATRLKDTCPKRHYTQADAAYDDRMRLAFQIMTVVCIDLRSIWAKLHMLEWALGAARDLATWQQITATMAFLDGERLGRGVPQIGFFARHGAGRTRAGTGGCGDGDAGANEPQEADDVEGADDADDALPDDEFTRRMMAVEGRTQHATDTVLAPLLAAAAAIAQDLVEVWAAYGRFCRIRLGVSPQVMMRAWDMPLLDDLELMLADYASVRPRREKVVEYAGYCCANWDRKFGGGDDDDTQ